MKIDFTHCGFGNTAARFPYRFHSHDYYDVVTKQLLHDDDVVMMKKKERRHFVHFLIHRCVERMRTVYPKRKRRKIEDKNKCQWKSIT